MKPVKLWAIWDLAEKCWFHVELGTKKDWPYRVSAKYDKLQWRRVEIRDLAKPRLKPESSRRLG